MKLAGLAFRIAGVQFHGTSMVFRGPIRTKMALAGQVLPGTKMVTDTLPLGGRVPFGGVKVIPAVPLLEVDQFSGRRIS